MKNLKLIENIFLDYPDAWSQKTVSEKAKIDSMTKEIEKLKEVESKKDMAIDQKQAQEILTASEQVQVNELVMNSLADSLKTLLTEDLKVYLKKQETQEGEQNKTRENLKENEAQIKAAEKKLSALKTEREVLINKTFQCKERLKSIRNDIAELNPVLPTQEIKKDMPNLQTLDTRPTSPTWQSGKMAPNEIRGNITAIPPAGRSLFN